MRGMGEKEQGGANITKFYPDVVELALSAVRMKGFDTLREGDGTNKTRVDLDNLAAYVLGVESAKGIIVDIKRLWGDYTMARYNRGLSGAEEAQVVEFVNAVRGGEFYVNRGKGLELRFVIG